MWESGGLELHFLSCQLNGLPNKDIYWDLVNLDSQAPLSVESLIKINNIKIL